MAFVKHFAACLFDRRREKVVYVTSALFTRDVVRVGLLQIDGLDLNIVTNDMNFLDSLGLMTGKWLAGALICRQRVVLRSYNLSAVGGAVKSSAYPMPAVNI